MTFPAFTIETPLSMDQIYASYVTHVLNFHSWNKAHAAKTLGVNRRTLYRVIERYDIQEPAPNTGVSNSACPDCGTDGQ